MMHVNRVPKPKFSKQGIYEYYYQQGIGNFGSFFYIKDEKQHVQLVKFFVGPKKKLIKFF